MCPSSTSSSDPAPPPASDGLIPLPDERLAGRERGIALCVVGFFLTCTLGAGLADLVRPAPLPRLEGEERVRDERRRERARVVDGSRMAVWGGDLDQRSNLRRLLVPYYTAALLRFLGEANEEVLVGREGWLFLRSRIEPPDEPSEAVARLGARTLVAVERRLAAADIELGILFVPRRAVMCEPLLPDRIDVRADVDRAMLELVQAAGLPAADLFAAYAGHAIEELWWRRDTHWGRLGQLLAAEAVCRAMGIAEEPSERSSRLEPGDVSMEAKQGLLPFLGIRPQGAAARLFLPPDPTPRLELLEPPRPDTGAEPLVLVGTSFSTDMLAPYLEHVADAPVINAAQQGTHFVETLSRYLAEHRADPPARVVLEVPVHQLLTPLSRRQTYLEELFVEHPPRRTTVLAELTPAPAPRGERRKRVVATFGPGELVSSADGALALRLSGDGAGRRLEMLLEVGRRRLSLAWEPGTAELVLPIVHDAEPEAAFAVSAVGEGAHELRVERLELVTELDVAEHLGPSSPPRADPGGGWVAGWTIGIERPPGRHAALFLQLDPAAGVEGPLTPALVRTDGTRLVLDTVHVARGARVQVRFGAAGAGTWSRLEVRGEGVVPAGVGMAVVLALDAR